MGEVLKNSRDRKLIGITGFNTGFGGSCISWLGPANFSLLKYQLKATKIPKKKIILIDMINGARPNLIKVSHLLQLLTKKYWFFLRLQRHAAFKSRPSGFLMTMKEPPPLRPWLWQQLPNSVSWRAVSLWHSVGQPNRKLYGRGFV